MKFEIYKLYQRQIYMENKSSIKERQGLQGRTQKKLDL